MLFSLSIVLRMMNTNSLQISSNWRDNAQKKSINWSSTIPMVLTFSLFLSSKSFLIGQHSSTHISLAPNGQACIPLNVQQGEVIAFTWKEQNHVWDCFCGSSIEPFAFWSHAHSVQVQHHHWWSVCLFLSILHRSLGSPFNIVLQSIRWSTLFPSMAFWSCCGITASVFVKESKSTSGWRSSKYIRIEGRWSSIREWMLKLYWRMKREETIWFVKRKSSN